MGLPYRVAAWVGAAVLGLTVISVQTPPQVPGSAAHTELIFVQAPVIRESPLPGRFPKGSRIVRLAGNESGVPANLTPEFFAAADPHVSFDGLRVLFSAQKSAAATWQVWEMNIDGKEKRQVTHCAGDCLRPAYLPRDEIVLTTLTAQSGHALSQLGVSKRDGSELRQITFGPGDFQVETVLRNGMILASARSPLLPAGEAASDRGLYTLRPDGSELASFRCDHTHPARRGEADELDDGSVVFVKSSVRSTEAGGELAAIRRGALHNSTLSPLRAESWSPRRLEGQKLIVARKELAAPGTTAKFDLYEIDSRGGTFDRVIYRDPRLSSIEAVPVAAHTPPRWYWSTLNPALQTAYFICLDSYHAADTPKGRITVPIGRVRVLALDSTTNRESVLGEAPVEKDGSFYIAVPPDRPVRFALLDAQGQVIREQRGWIWSRSGEERGCAGCHEDKAMAPENHWPETLRRFDTPTPLGLESAAQPAH